MVSCTNTEAIHILRGRARPPWSCQSTSSNQPRHRVFRSSDR